MAYINPFTGRPYVAPFSAIGSWEALFKQPFATLTAPPIAPSAVPASVATPTPSQPQSQPSFPAYNGIQTMMKPPWKPEQDYTRPFPSYTSRRNRI